MTATAPKIRIMVVDDHPVARAGLLSIISCEPDMEVASEAGSFEEAVRGFSETIPDVTLMDIRLPGRSGIDAMLAIRRLAKDPRFVVLTSHAGDELIRQAISAGAQSYLYKDMVRNELTAAIRTVHGGRKYIPVDVSSRLFEFPAGSQVTARELDVLRLAAEGLGNRDIAAKLRITEFTVKAHVQSLLSKLEASDRTHTVTIALKRGLLFL
jgi:DNA-binding NarL/FixJ family response regulator